MNPHDQKVYDIYVMWRKLLGRFFSTAINQIINRIMACINNFIHVKQWNVITHPVNEALVKNMDE